MLKLRVGSELTSKTKTSASETFKRRYVLSERNAQFVHFAWSPLGSQLAACTETGIIRVWNTQTGLTVASREHAGRMISAIAWSPDGRKIAYASADITIWDLAADKILHELRSHAHSVWSLAWNSANELASASHDKSICIWNTVSGIRLEKLVGHTAEVTSVAWSPDNAILASGSADGTVRLWADRPNGKGRVLQGHRDAITSLTWAKDGRLLESGSSDRTIITWNPITGRQVRVLEGHTAGVTALSYSADAQLLLSASDDGNAIIWRASNAERVSSIRSGGRGSAASPFLVLFSPTDPLIATIDRSSGGIVLRDLPPNFPQQTALDVETFYYRNAKVLLVGDTGVGKSGLALVLTGRKWVPTESTHARKVWTISTHDLSRGKSIHETRETLLWDLAGQPDYRLIHQLHLHETALALVVFDARCTTDPLSGVRHWVRALDQVQRIEGSAALALKKFLVTARVDVGRVSISDQGLNDIAAMYGFDRIFKTSAKELWGIPELMEAIADSIPWDSLPKGSSNQIFQSIKTFLLLEKQSGRVLSSVEDLFRTYLANDPEFKRRTEAKAEFITCIGLIESRDLIHRLSFGDLVLLQPELLDTYATAIVNAAKDEPAGLGAIPEEIIRLGAFRMPESERVSDKQQEQLLLLATIEELLRHEIALRDGSQLVFPSQLTRENPDLVDAEEKAISYSLKGPIANVYATLAVRLSQSGLFRRVDMWKNGVTYRAKAGGICGILLDEIDDGAGTFTVFFDYGASFQTRAQFEDFVHTHLQRYVGADGLRVRRPLRCSNIECQVEIPEEIVTRRRDRGFLQLTCPVCDQNVNLTSGSRSPSELDEDVVYKMDIAADHHRDKDVQSSILNAKRALCDFDVYLAYDKAARADVRRFARRLQDRGILPWFDEWQAPGDWKRQLDRDITRIRSGALIVGRDGASPWDSPPHRESLEYLLSRGRPVFPVALHSGSARSARGYAELPELHPTLPTRRWFDLRDNSNEELERFIRTLPATSVSRAEVRADDLQKRLSAIRPGKDDASLYHKTVAEAVAQVFDSSLKFISNEQPLNSGAKRVDTFFENRATAGFFADLSAKHGIHCPYVFLECKNYSTDLANPDFDQLAGRFSKTTTAVGILACRAITDRAAMISYCRNLMKDRRDCILVLQDDDLRKLLSLRANDDPEGVSDFMSARLREILL